MHTGQQIRDFILGEKIGEGGMGEVWSATHQVLHRSVAIKAMAAHLATDPQFGERFVQEARAQAILQHPRIVGVTDFFQEGGVYYLIMPLVTGRPLDERLAEAGGPLPLGEATHIASDLLDALDYAHQRGIIHRDVKPSNVLLDRDGHAYLMDFGIALLVGQDRRTRTGTSLGTPHYMSPEQIRAPRTVDHRADVYSVSCVIYEMLAGRPPFVAEDADGDTDFVLKEAHLRRDPAPIRTWNPTVPAALDAVVLRGLAKDPNLRFGGCGELRRALEAAAAGLTPPLPPLPHGVQTTPPPLPPPLPSQRRPRMGFLVGIGCGVLLALAALVALGMALSKPDPPAVEEPPVATEPALTEPAMTEPMATEPMGTEPMTTEPLSAAPVESPLGGRFVKVWADHNIERDGRTGMLIHSHFTIDGARQDLCQAAAYFHFASGDILKDFNQAYRAVDGQVSVGEDFTPTYDSSEYEDFQLFIPYEELHLATGEHQLKFNVQIHHRPTNSLVAESPYVTFSVSRP